jgi:hypothetical protein
VAISTASVTLIDAIIAELQDHLPDALEAAGLPAVAQWCFGQRRLVPMTRTPQIQVDLSLYRQFGRSGDDMRRENSLVVFALLAASDEEALHRELVGYGDVICAVLEADITPKLHVTSVDTSPAFSPQGSNALFRAVAVEATLPGKLHHAGDV